MTPELEMGDNLRKNGKDVTLKGLKAERQTGEKGEGMIWIWVKCGGNSRWPVKDDFRRGCVVDFCLRCLLYHPTSDEKRFSKSKIRVGKLFFFVLKTDIISDQKQIYFKDSVPREM